MAKKNDLDPMRSRPIGRSQEEVEAARQLSIAPTQGMNPNTTKPVPVKKTVKHSRG